MARPQDPIGNRLLAALADAGTQRWRQCLQRLDLEPGQVLYEPGRIQRHAYFPTSAVVSLLYTLQSGASTGIALVGSEGIVGASVFLGAETTTSCGSVLIGGQGFRIEAQIIKDEFDRSPSVRHLLLSYTQALATQIAQTAVCNRLHAIEQQVCGWLLHSLDRLQGHEVVVTQELIASMLGVRRESVTEAAGKLQSAGLIRCAPGHVSVLDREGLERRTCECHAVIKKEYDRLLPQESAARPAELDRRMWPAPAQAATSRRASRHELAAMGER